MNKFFGDNNLKLLKIDLFDDETDNSDKNTITEEQYQDMIIEAEKMGKERLSLIMQTIVGCCGLRVSELAGITVESLKDRIAEVENKGKIRNVYIPKRLARKLRAYCKKHNITSGIIFHSLHDKNKVLDRSIISKELKKVAGKVFLMKKECAHPHSLRHRFSQRYANMPGYDPYLLPILMGHSKKGLYVTSLYIEPDTKGKLAIVDAIEEYYYNQEKERQKKLKDKQKQRRKSRVKR